MCMLIGDKYISAFVLIYVDRSISNSFQKFGSFFRCLFLYVTDATTEKNMKINKYSKNNAHILYRNIYQNRQNSRFFHFTCTMHARTHIDSHCEFNGFMCDESSECNWQNYQINQYNVWHRNVSAYSLNSKNKYIHDVYIKSIRTELGRFRHM